MKWIEVTDCFSESQRHYKDKYLIIDEVLDDTVEVSLFSSPDGIDIVWTRLLINLRIRMNFNIRRNFILTVLFCKIKIEENPTGFSFLFRTLYYNKDSDCGKRRKKRND